MQTRRHLLAATGATLLAGLDLAAQAADLPVPPNGEIGFRILRNGSDVGRHQLNFEQDGDQLRVRIEIDIRVGIGPVALYRYQHHGTEIWQGGVLVRMDSHTDDDGDPENMRAERGPDGLHVSGSKTDSYVAPPGTLCSTYWNRAMLQSRIISSQDGRLFTEQITKIGASLVMMAGGDSEMTAIQYQLRGDLPIDIWYDQDGQWAHLTFTKRGSNIVYVKL